MLIKDAVVLAAAVFAILIAAAALAIFADLIAVAALAILAILVLNVAALAALAAVVNALAAAPAAATAAASAAATVVTTAPAAASAAAAAVAAGASAAATVVTATLAAAVDALAAADALTFAAASAAALHIAAVIIVVDVACSAVRVHPDAVRDTPQNIAIVVAAAAAAVAAAMYSGGATALVVLCATLCIGVHGPFDLFERSGKLGPVDASIICASIAVVPASLLEMAGKLLSALAPIAAASVEAATARLASRAVIAGAVIGSAMRAMGAAQRAAEKLGNHAFFAANSASYGMFFAAVSFAVQIVAGVPPTACGPRTALVGVVGAGFAITDFGSAALMSITSAGARNWTKRPLYRAAARGRVGCLYWLGPRSPVAWWRASKDETAAAARVARPIVLEWIYQEAANHLSDNAVSAMRHHIMRGRFDSVEWLRRRMSLDLSHVDMLLVQELLCSEKIDTIDWLEARGVKCPPEAILRMELLNNPEMVPSRAVVAWASARANPLELAELEWAGRNVPSDASPTAVVERERRARFVGAFRQMILQRVLALVVAGRRRRLQLPQELWQMVADQWAAQAAAGVKLSAHTVAAITAPHRN